MLSSDLPAPAGPMSNVAVPRKRPPPSNASSVASPLETASPTGVSSVLFPASRGYTSSPPVLMAKS